MVDGEGTSDAELARRRAARAERAGQHQAAHERRREHESAKAQLLVDRFVADALGTELPTERLTARPWSGRGRYRTGLIGWYLRSDRSIAVAVDGGYHQLVVAPLRFGRWRAVRLSPTPPPLQVGEGARDGESIELAELLRMRLG
jgi:hypothetical protein